MMKFVDCNYPKHRAAICTATEAHEYIKTKVKYDGAYRTVNGNGDTKTMTYQKGNKLVARIIYRVPGDYTQGATLCIYK